MLVAVIGENRSGKSHLAEENPIVTRSTKTFFAERDFFDLTKTGNMVLY